MAFWDVLALAGNIHLPWELIYVKSVPRLEATLADVKVIYGVCCRKCACRCTVQLASALITDWNLADARFYSKYNLVFLQKAVIKLLFVSEWQIRMQLESQAWGCACVKFNFSLCLFIVLPSISTRVSHLQFSFHIQIQNVFCNPRLPPYSQCP